MRTQCVVGFGLVFACEIRAEYGSQAGGWVWCLWCLFEAEIGAIYAEQLKQLQYKEP